MKPDEPYGLLDRVQELGPLGERFRRAARRALERAAGLPAEEQRRVRAALLEAAVYESERVRRAEASRRALADLSASLGEASRRLRQASEEASASLERLREVRRRLDILRGPR